MRIATNQAIGPQEFFRQLSAKDGWIHKGYDRHIAKVDQPMFGNIDEARVYETAKPSFFSPIRFFLFPESGTEKLAVACSIQNLTSAYAERVVKDPNCNIARISNVFRRMATSMSRNVSQKEAAQIHFAFDKAIQSLQKKNVEAGIGYFAGGQPGHFSVGDALGRNHFYKALSKTWWPYRFNQRFHIGQTPGGEFRVFVTKNRWFFQKVFAWPKQTESWRDYFAKPESPAVAKIANAENLVKMIVHDRELIRAQQIDVTGIIRNLEKIKGKMTNHTNFVEKTRIETAMDQAIKQLRKTGMLINKDQNNSWRAFVWRWTVTPAARATAGLAKGTWWAINLPFSHFGGK